MRSEPDAGRRGDLLARGPGRNRDVHGLRHRGLSGLRGAPNVRLLRPGVHGRPRLPRRLDPVGRPACAPALQGGGLSGPLEVGGVRLKTPVMAASGTFGYGTEVPLCERRLLGGMVSKGIFLEPRLGTPPPRIVETPSGMLNAIGLQGPGVEALIADYAPQWATWDFPVLVNITCPNVREGGMFFGNDPGSAAAVTEAVRRRTRLPVWVKLTPAVTDISEIARACEAAGADALSAINTFVGMSFDLRSRQPRLAFRTGGLSGPAIRPMAVYLAHRAAQAVSIPVVGIGGIMSAEDAVEFLLAGCRAVQVGTATFLDPNAIGKIVEGLRPYQLLLRPLD